MENVGEYHKDIEPHYFPVLRSKLRNGVNELIQRPQERQKLQ